MLPFVFASSSFLDWPDNESSAVVFFFAGCSNGCHNCQTPELQAERNRSEWFSNEELVEKLADALKQNRTSKLVISGGDSVSLYPSDLKEFLEFAKSKIQGLEICIYTGCSFDSENVKTLKGCYDFIKCGRYDDSKKVVSEKTDDFIQLASTNQAFYDKHGNCLSKNGKLVFQR